MDAYIVDLANKTALVKKWIHENNRLAAYPFPNETLVGYTSNCSKKKLRHDHVDTAVQRTNFKVFDVSVESIGGINIQ